MAGCLTTALTAMLFSVSIDNASTKQVPTGTAATINPHAPIESAGWLDAIRSFSSLDPTGTIPRHKRTPHTYDDEPFGHRAVPAADGDLWHKWRSVEAGIESETDVLRRCRNNSGDCPAEAARLLTIVDAATRREGRARIGEINRAINLLVRPTSDQAQFGVPDHWASPLITLASGRGDCEDYAIAKYLALREAGIPAADLRLVIVHDGLAKEDHAVLAARLEERWLILDNRHHTLVESTEARNFRPLFALDHEGVRRFAPALAEGPPAPARTEPMAARGDALTYLKIAD